MKLILINVSFILNYINKYVLLALIYSLLDVPYSLWIFLIEGRGAPTEGPGDREGWGAARKEASGGAGPLGNDGSQTHSFKGYTRICTCICVCIRTVGFHVNCNWA